MAAPHYASLRKNVVELGKALLLLLICTALGLLLLVGIFSLPNGTMRENVLASYQTMEAEGNSRWMIASVPSTRLDGYTDSLMLCNAAFNGPMSVWQKAIGVYRYAKDENIENYSWNILLTLRGEGTLQSYARYWHGYLLFLMPLIALVDVDTIRLLNMLVQLLLLAGVISQLSSKGLRRLIFPLVMTYFFLSPVTLFFSFQYSAVYYTAMGSTFALLMFWNQLQARGWERLFFMLVGILTCYFDFLTYPVVTLGLPLVVWITLQSGNEPLGKQLWQGALLCLFWVIGYGGMWGCKWVIAALTLGPGELQTAWSTVLERSSKLYYTTPTTVPETIGRNAQAFFASKRILVVFCAPVFAWLLFNLGRYKVIKPSGAKLLLCIAAFAIPFLWYSFATNHASVHAQMTYRCMAVSVFAGLTLLASCFGKAPVNHIKRG